MPTKHIEVGHCKVLDVSKIEPSPLNVRLLEVYQESENADEFIELCNSIRADGLIHPIVVRKKANDSGYEAIAGSRRLHALKHIGVKEAPTILREMSDNDVRIASLVENIHREDIGAEIKEQSLKDIYAGEGYADIRLVEKYLSTLQNRRWREKIRKKPVNISKVHRIVEIPKDFEKLCDRIGWTPGYQYNIIRGLDFRSHHETNYLVDTKGQMVDDELEDIPEFSNIGAKERLKQNIGLEIEGLDNRKALKTVQQYVHDIKTGAIRQDAETGEFRYFPSKSEDISKIETELNPAAAREQIIDVGKVLFKLITGVDMYMVDIHVAEKQAQSKSSRDNMHEICTQSLEPRELRVLQDVAIPLQIALSKLIDEIERL